MYLLNTWRMKSTIVTMPFPQLSVSMKLPCIEGFLAVNICLGQPILASDQTSVSIRKNIDRQPT